MKAVCALAIAALSLAACVTENTPPVAPVAATPAPVVVQPAPAATPPSVVVTPRAY